MNKNTLLIIAFVLLLLPYPLISFGTVGDVDALWWLGLAALVVGGLIPPVTRYLFDEDEGESGGEGEARGEGEFIKGVDRS